MTDPANPIPSAQKPISPRRLLLWAVGLLGLLVVIIVLGVQYNKHRLRAQCQAVLDQMKRDGYPTTLAEIDASYKVPEGVNGADLWKEAFDLFPESHDIPDDLPDLGITCTPRLGEACPPEQVELMRDFLGKHQKLLDAVHRAADADAPCRFPVDATKGFDIKIEHWRALRSLLRLKCVGTKLHLSEPTISNDAILRDLREMLAICKTLDKEPFFTAFLVSMSFRNITVFELQHIALRSHSTWQHLVRNLPIDCFTEESPKRLQISLTFEMLCHLNDFEDISEGNIEYSSRIYLLDFSSREKQFVNLLAYTGRVRKDQLFFMTNMAMCIQRYEMPHVERKVFFDSLTSSLAGDNSPLGIRVLRSNLMSSQLLNAYVGFSENDACHQTYMRTVRTAMAVERYRMKTGALPAVLADLVPEFLDAVPLDPFDGKPLRYKQTTPGFVVYSVGDDLKDDGGADDSFPTTLRYSPDIIFVVPE